MTEGYIPATSTDMVKCTNCDNLVDTPEEIESYPDGNCPECGSSWTGEEKRSTIIQATVPKKLGGGTS